MRKQKLIFASLVILFLVVAFATITTLANQLPDPDGGSGGGSGKWQMVCCGLPKLCGQDVCMGTGTLNCCK